MDSHEETIDLTPEPDEKVVLEVILSKEKGVLVRSVMLFDQMACLGLLEMAKVEVNKHHAALASKIVKPNRGLMSYLKNGQK